MEEFYRQVSEELDIPQEVVEEAYKSFFTFIRDTVKELPLKEPLTEEEFNKLRCNFNIPSLGKLNLTWDRFQRMKQRFNYISKLREKQNGSKED